MAKYPAALRRAKTIVDASSDTKIPMKNIWLTETAGVFGTHSIRYEDPRTSVTYAMNRQIVLTQAEQDEYNFFMGWEF